jgi:hypothetical protein
LLGEAAFAFPLPLLGYIQEEDSAVQLAAVAIIAAVVLLGVAARGAGPAVLQAAAAAGRVVGEASVLEYRTRRAGSKGEAGTSQTDKQGAI